MLELINVEGLYCHCMSFIDNDLSLMSEEERNCMMVISGCSLLVVKPLLLNL